ncbi:hypothetical protein JCM6882_009046 [Rhodosporidiobolus microsporus]
MAGSGSFDFLAFRKQFEQQDKVRLAHSGIPEAAAAASAAASSSSKPKSKPKNGSKPAASSASSKPSSSASSKPTSGGGRRSDRPTTQATTAASEKTAGEGGDEARQEIAAIENRKLAKHQPRNIVPLQIDGFEGFGDRKSLIDFLEELEDYDEDLDDPRPKWVLGQRVEADEAELRRGLEKVERRAMEKVTPARIYSLAVHPDPERALVFAGDKKGHVGVWDCTSELDSVPSKASSSSIRDGMVVEDSDGEEEWEDAQTKWVWEAHIGNADNALKAVNGLAFRPGHFQEIYSASLDNTIRSHSFYHTRSDEILDADRLHDASVQVDRRRNDDPWKNAPSLTSFTFDATGNELWATDNKGGLIFRDMRSGSTIGKRWQIDYGQVNSIDLNAANSSMAVTSHGKHYVRIWNLSALRTLAPNTPPAQVAEAACVVEYPFDGSGKSAYFDPTGTRLAGTGYDDYVRIWDIDPQKLSGYPVGRRWKPRGEFIFKSQVGMYLCPLRARWSTSASAPPHLHIGDLTSHLHLHSPSGSLIKAVDNRLTIPKPDECQTSGGTVPAITASHPKVEGLYWAGTAAGRVSFFAPAAAEE